MRRVAKVGLLMRCVGSPLVSPQATSSMRIDPFVRDLAKFQGDLASALDEPGTRLYLDTSTLMWLVRLSRTARAEFMAWCAKQNTFVPVWAAHEFQRHLLMGTVRTNMVKVVAETASKQREFAQIAAEQADDALCLAKGYVQRSGYISEIQRLMASFHQLGRVLELDEERLRLAADEVIEFVNLRTLSSDLDSIIAELSTTGDFRLSHRVPPGYKDAHKDENSLGDAVIWQEILQDVGRVTRPSAKPRGWLKWPRQAKPLTGVLVSRDEKTDWVSSSFVRKLDGNVVKSDRELELEVVLPHPMLCHEFERRGGATFFLAHPAALSGVVEAIQKKGGQPSTVTAWRAASLRPDVLEKLLAQAAQEEKKLQAMRARANPSPGAQRASTQSASVPLPTAQLVLLADLATIAASDVMRGSVSQSVQAFIAAGAPDRDELLLSWRSSVNEGTLLATRLGRILCGVASEASGMEVAQIPAALETLQRHLPRFADHLLLGALCTAFFDDEGQLLQRPKSTLAAVLLPMEDTTSSSAAFSALQRMLGDLSASLPYVPGSKQKIKVLFTASSATTSQPAMLQDLRLGGQAVFVDGLSKGHPRCLSVLLGEPQSHQCKVALLLGLLSREYLVPLARLDASGISESKLISWRPGAGLLPIDTNAPGGVGELDDEDFE